MRKRTRWWMGSGGGIPALVLIAATAHADPLRPPRASDRSGGDAPRPFTVDPDVLGACSRNATADGRLRLDLSDGDALVAVVESLEPAALSDCVWRGRLEGVPGGWFILVVNDGIVMGEVSAPPLGHFHIRCAGGGRHIARRIDDDRRLRCLSGSDHAVTAAPIGTAPHPGPAVPGGVGPLIDVMVVYTASSRVTVGGTAAMEALIDSYFVFTNAAYEQSGVNQRVRLVHAQEISYTESGNSNVDLQRLRDTNDGFMDEVHPLRDAWGADLVSLINTSGSAGVAFMMQNLSVSFASSAFSAIGADTGSIPGGLVFAHETAHNMGCSHNHFPGAPQGVFCYSFGYRTPDAQWRTIMSSSPGTFVDFFSSPDLEFEGQPLGVAGDGCPPDAADNVRSLNEAAATVARFRPTVVACGADADCDGDVDLIDFETLLQCVTGPAGVIKSDCATFDFDGDNDVDFADFGVFQAAFTDPA